MWMGRGGKSFPVARRAIDVNRREEAVRKNRNTSETEQLGQKERIRGGDRKNVHPLQERQTEEKLQEVEMISVPGERHRKNAI